MSIFIRKLRNWRFNSQHDIEGVVELDSANVMKPGAGIKIYYNQMKRVQEFDSFWRVEEEFTFMGCLSSAVYILPKKEENR